MANDSDRDKTAKNRDYEVGYCKPPIATRFKKGQSGNPRGRPKGSRNLDKLLEIAFNEAIPVNENGGRRLMSKREAIVKQFIAKALSGDRPWVQMALVELAKIDARMAQTESIATALEAQAEKVVQRAILSELSTDERINLLEAGEKYEELSQLALSRYQAKLDAAENERIGRCAIQTVAEKIKSQT